MTTPIDDGIGEPEEGPLPIDSDPVDPLDAVLAREDDAYLHWKDDEATKA